MLIFRVPYRSISTSALQRTVYISLILHGVQDINMQLFKTILDAVLYTITWCIYSLMMIP
jgi:hypothetical protein